MTTATLTYFPVAAGNALATSLGRTGLWGLGQFMRAPFVISAVLAMSVFTLIAGHNALYDQPERHPAPLFFSPPKTDLVSPARAATTARTPSHKLVAPVIPASRPQNRSISTLIDANTTGSLGTTATPANVGNADVFAVQQKLQALGLFQGDLDGYYGPRTANAIRAFEDKTGRKSVGALSPEIMAAILKTSALDQTRSPEPAPIATPPKMAALAAPAPLKAEPINLVAPRAAATVPLPTRVANVVKPRLPQNHSAMGVFDAAASDAAGAFDAITNMVGDLTKARTVPSTPARLVPERPINSVPSAQSPELNAPGSSTVAMNVGARNQTVNGGANGEAANLAGPVPPAAQKLAVQIGSAPPSEIALASATNTDRPNQSGTDPALVEKIQRGLASLGFLGGRIDGVPNEATAKAIRNFEVFYNYKVTGQATPQLLKLLEAQNAVI